MPPGLYVAVSVAALAGALVALFTLVQRSRGPWRHPLAVGLLAAACELAAAAAGQRAESLEAALRWWELSLAAGALVPASWLAFGIAFARADAAAALRRSRWLLLAALLVPLALALPLHDRLLARADAAAGPYLRLGGAGYLLQVAQLLAAVLVLGQMERTLRASTGSRRWLVKFVVIGVCTLFAARIYAASQSLLFRAIDTRLLAVSAGAFALALVSLAVGYVRLRGRGEVYLSPTALYGSFTTVIVAVYLLVVGVLAAVAARVGGGAALPIVGLALLAALWALSLLVLSDEARHRLRLLVSRHFHRPVYDYRLEWRRFTLRTGATLDARELCAAFAAWVADTLNLRAVSVWLVEESGAVTLGGSTLREASDVLPAETARALAEAARAEAARAEAARAPGEPARGAGPEALPGPPAERPEDLRFVMPLRSGGTTVGLVSHSDRATGVPLDEEDLELLRIAGEQAASRLLGVRLSERLARARENEAFQSLSAFFVHDLKNLASRLSLSVQNLPARIEDPAFRADFVAMLTRSVARIDEMCARLSPLTRRLELRLGPEELDAVVACALDELREGLRARLVASLSPVPGVRCDAGELHKVVTNLVTNADQASAEGGEIRIATGVADGFAFVSVADDGCGMAPEFVEGSLFQPFRSTKAKGLGIGLYQSRRIVEAHGGRIQVESEPGRGTTFRVLLPAAGPGARERAWGSRSC